MFYLAVPNVTTPVPTPPTTRNTSVPRLLLEGVTQPGVQTRDYEKKLYGPDLFVSTKTSRELAALILKINYRNNLTV